MKPPWKFVAELMSRRRPSETSDQPIEPVGDRKLIPLEAPPAPPLLSVPPEEDSKPDHAAIAAATASGEARTKHQADVDAAAPAALPTAAGDATAAAADEPQPADASVRAPEREDGPSLTLAGTPQGRLPKAAKKNRAVTIPAHPTHSDQAAQHAPAGDPPVGDAASLDEDIKQLRDQLADKLRLQNAQLRKMLARFDRA